MDDSELEEGEACDYALDPDAYSYIDEKIQNCLGHLQKEFVGGELSAEHLGAKFGGYGSFLPTHRRSPSVLPQPRSPPKPPNNRNSISPCNPPLEGTHRNRSVVTSTSISTRNIPQKVPSTDNPTKKEILTSGPSSRAPPTQKHSSSKSSVGGGTDQKTLKVRIKVGNESTLRKNNAEIYSGLGLDISPSTSLEGSSGGSAGRSAESRGIPGESPQSILETMTCSVIPGGFLLSPIRGCFINFTGKTIPMSRNAPNGPQFLAESNLLTKEAKAHKPKNFRPDEKNHMDAGMKVLKDSGMKVSKELPALPSKEQMDAIDLVKEKLELVEGDQGYASKSVENGDVNSKVNPKIRSIKGDKKLFQSKKERVKDSSLDIQRKSKGESKKTISISKADSVESNRNGDQSAGPSNAMENLSEVEYLAEVKVQPQFEERRVQKEKQSSTSTSTDRKKESIMRSKKSETLPKNELEKEFRYEFSGYDLSEKKKKPAAVKIQNEKNFASLREAPPKEKPSYSKPENVPVPEVQVNNPQLAHGDLTSAEALAPPIPEALAPPIPPMEIKENWVACDKCHKWRLLPYWTNPESLPKKWHCKLLDWLPGKNRCDVGEEETTAGANALNLVQLPLPGTANASASFLPDPNAIIPVHGAVQCNTVPSQIPKKKKEHREGTDLTNPLNKREKASLKGNFETTSYGSGGLGIESRSADFTAEKQKFRHHNSGRYSDGGDNLRKSDHSRSKNKRPVEPDDSKAFKKIKKEDSHPGAKEKRPESDLARNVALDIVNTSSKKASLKSSFNERLETKGVKVERSENFSASEIERHDRVPERTDGAQEKKIREQKQGDKVPNSNRRDVAYVHPSVEATSSSSKVSGSRSRSRRSKTKLCERKGSPVESVSSSPVRHLSNEKLHRKGIPVKEEVVNTTSYTLPMVSPKRGPSTEIERPSKLPRLSETQRSIVEDVKMGGVSRNLPPEQDSRHFEKKSTQLADRSNHQESHDGSNQRKIAKSDPKVSSRPKEKHRSHTDKAVTEKPQPAGNKLEPETSGTRIVASTVNENRIHGNGDLPKAPQPKKPETANGLPPNGVRQATPNPLDTSSPARRDAHSAVYALLKEARALKHTADRMKNHESELDTVGLYFEAALKFLQSASLCEPASGDTSRQGDATQAMQIYSDTAKLCDFCAQTYERFKKMGAAALAFKCVEVAYLKAAFYKNHGASRDRHELQTTLQLVQLGESPSSSASDIDNLNNHGLAKVASVKDSNSPQVVGANHLMAARNHPHMMRLLAYTNDLNCAFEATRKSQAAFATVNTNPENGELDANVVASIRSALDFGFHNVRELVQLVRVSMESVCS